QGYGELGGTGTLNDAGGSDSYSYATQQSIPGLNAASLPGLYQFVQGYGIDGGTGGLNNAGVATQFAACGGAGKRCRGYSEKAPHPGTGQCLWGKQACPSP